MDFDILDSALAEKGHLRIEWAASRMPVLAAIKKRFEKEQPLAGVKIGACMHVTTETATLMQTLIAGGAEVAICASNPLSTQDDVAAALVDVGIPTYAVRGEDADTFYTHINAVLDTQPHLVFDDGADMTTVLHKERTEQNVVGGMEETTTGVIRLKAMEAAGVLRYPIVAVNDSDTKHLFDNRHGTGQSSLDGILRASNILFAGKRVVVAGFGDCGWGIATRAKGLGADVIVTEIDPIRAVAATMEGHRVMSGLEAAEIGEVFITATGNLHVFRAEHFARMPDGAIIANAGHFDVELDLVALDEMSVSRRVIRDNLEEYTLEDGRRILVVAEGRLVNLGAAEGHPADVMDMSFADQALAAEWIIQNQEDLEAKVYVLPKELDDDVARLKLEAMSGSLEKLTPAQEHYLASWEHGT
jgi:adenosylhomocysteinase